MRTAILTLLVVFVCAILGCFVAGFAGWEHGHIAGKIGAVWICFLGTLAIIADFNRKRRAEPLAPVKRTAIPQRRDFPPREFRHNNRELLTGVLGFFAVAGLLGALGAFVVRLTHRDLPPGAAEAITAILLLFGSVCAWCAARVWTAYVLLEPEGVTVHTTYARGRFDWDELIAFERVQISDGNGEMHWWFRLVTAKKAYLFQDTLEDREWFVRTVTRASGLELVDAD